MSRRLMLIIGFLLIGASVLSACSTTAVEAEEDEHMDDEHMDDEHMDDDHMGDEHMGDEHMGDEHMEGGMHMHVDPPEEYADLENPFAGDHEAAGEGEALFMANCVPCHGETGEGDGPAASVLTPQPANLSDTAMMDMMTDAYMFWRISEGGAFEPFNSAMPAWKEVLDEEQRWQLVTFVRELAEHGH